MKPKDIKAWDTETCTFQQRNLHTARKSKKRAVGNQYNIQDELLNLSGKRYEF